MNTALLMLLLFLGAVVLSLLLTKRIVVRWAGKLEPTERLLLGVCVFAAMFFVVAGLSIAGAYVYRQFAREVVSAISQTTDAIEQMGDRDRVSEESIVESSEAEVAERARLADDQRKKPPPLAIAPFDADQAKRHQRAWADYLGVPVEEHVDLGDGVKLAMVLIPPGEFLMGSSESAESLAKEFDTRVQYSRNEHPRHRVRITRSFYLGTHEVTVGEFREFVEAQGYQTEAERDGQGACGWDESVRKFTRNASYSWRNAGFPQDERHPVVNVSWNDAVAFCEWLSRKHNRTYRLPTEAEWEYACRAGTTTRYGCGDDSEGLASVGNVADASAKARYPDWRRAIESRDGYVYTAAVGRFQPNGFGLFDMHGNVWEWCADWYSESYYAESPVDDPKGPATGSERVARGGCWYGNPWRCRSAGRVGSAPGVRNGDLGFRVAQVLADVLSK